MPYARDYAQSKVTYFQTSRHVIDVSQTLKALPEGTVLATCWCERLTVVVPIDWPIQGKTNSCGHRLCHE